MTINCKGKLLDLQVPKVMGIINATPDSFFKDSRQSLDNGLIKRVEKMIHDGMDVLDIGGQSTRPGAQRVSEDEELNRTISKIESLHRHFPDLIISIDTFYSKVAKEAVQAGASIINDVSAGSLDENMFETVADLKVPYILMHMRGKPENMQEQTTYNNLFMDVYSFFTDKLERLRLLGVNDVILDPGFGFGKSVSGNYQLLSRISEFKTLDCPLLIGTSRKSMLTKLLNIKSDQALNATTITNTIALLQGASILRVHDVKEASECVKITSYIN